MTTDEWWTHIERFCKEGDTNGLLVAADGLADEGDEDIAATIRWAVRQRCVPDYYDGGVYGDKLYQWYAAFPILYSHRSMDKTGQTAVGVAEAFHYIHHLRIKALEFFQ